MGGEVGQLFFLVVVFEFDYHLRSMGNLKANSVVLVFLRNVILEERYLYLFKRTFIYLSFRRM